MTSPLTIVPTAPQVVDVRPYGMAEEAEAQARLILDGLYAAPDLTVFRDNLASWCNLHPVKAAQVLMVQAAYTNEDETVSVRQARAEKINAARAAA